MSSPATSAQRNSRSAGHAIVAQLQAQGIQRAYLVPGESFLDVLDGLHESSIEAVVCRQEGGAGFMALAEGRIGPARGALPGVAMVTRGPGAANAMIAVHTAYQDATPMVLFIGLIPMRDRDRESFQEFDPKAWFGSTTKRVWVLDDPDQAPSVVRDACHLAVSGRPGPVVVALPEDVLVQPCTAPPAAPRALPTWSGLDPAPVLHPLASATAPLVVVGGDRISAAGARDLARWAQAWQLPVLSDWRTQDMLDHDSPSWCGFLGYGGSPAAAELLRSADAVLFLGCLNTDVLSSGYTPGADGRWVGVVGTDPDLLGHDGNVDAHLLGGINEFAAAAAAAEVPRQRPWAARTAQARAAQAQFATPRPDGPGWGVDLGALMEDCAQRLPEDAVITYGAGNHALWAQRYLVHHRPGTLVAPRNGAMGVGIPAAVAAGLIHPGRRVLSVAGDGCFLMNAQELAVAAAAGVRLCVLVVDNSQYGTIREHQERHYPGRVSGTGLSNPDFAMYARSFGALGLSAATTSEAIEAVAEAFAYDALSLIHLRVDPDLAGPAAMR
ncbi:thiamine pyrophosphate-dependent enzyme [Gephyromycinifex aptenodytis]|uniref:thiamine pyrophosphate-dependent enzyme n=1 Tax=Gephyromycinifex aptenodytis TaxID=2716227 RepID=UPI001D02268A|nr:thiamine pyrophosphate-dependent enzyme [Gephyromycinifex aptenodytis]